MSWVQLIFVYVSTLSFNGWDAAILTNDEWPDYLEIILYIK